MKRSIAIILSLVLVLSFGSVTAVADFTPSAEVKDVPEFVSPEEEIDDPEVNPAEVVAIIYNGEEKTYVVDSSLSAISVAEAIAALESDEAEEAYIERCTALVNAYNGVKENGIWNSVSALDEVTASLGYIDPTVTIPYIFEIDITAEADKEALGDEDAYISVSFDISDLVLEDGTTILVAHMVDGAWEIIPVENTTIDTAEKVLSVEFDSFCPVMLLHVEGEIGEITEPTEGETSETETEPAEVESTEIETVTTDETEGETEGETGIDTDVTTDTDDASESETDVVSESETDAKDETETKDDNKTTDKQDNSTLVVIVACSVVAIIGAITIVVFTLYKKGVFVDNTKKKYGKK